MATATATTTLRPTATPTVCALTARQRSRYNDDAANREQGRQGSGWVLDNSGGWTYRHERYWPNPGGSRKSARTLDYTWSWRAQSKGAKSRGPWITVLGEDEKPGFFERLFTSAATFYGEVTNVAPAIDCATGDVSRCTDFGSGKVQALKALGRAIKGTSKGPECHSFLPGTDVLLADGSTKNIEEVKTGDQVTVTDPATGRTTVRKVAGTIVTEEDKKFVDLSITTGDAEKSAALISTVTHPFWVESEDRWVDAGDLKPGMTLRTSNGDTAKVQSVRYFERRQRTHDLTIGGIHTYYVLAGEASVLVHNTGPGCGPNISTRYEKAGDLGKYTEGQKTRDPASQWYHEYLSEEELLDGVNKAPKGDGILVSRDGTILGGHHRWDEIQTRVNDGRLDPDKPIRIDVYGGE
ncbi:polymorphic toxin-type HINT domain-containing protein [Streptomyces indonesiensis]